MSDCECFHPLYLDIDSNRGELRPCDLNNDTTHTCIDTIITEMNRGDRQGGEYFKYFLK